MKAINRGYGLGSIIQRGEVFYLRYQINGAMKTVSLHTTKEEETEAKASAILPRSLVSAETKEEVAAHVGVAKKLIKEATHKMPLTKVWEHFEKTSPNIGAGTLGNHCRNWKRFKVWMDANKPSIKDLSQIDFETASEYMQDFAASGVHSDTFNKQKLSLCKIWDDLSREAGLRQADNPFREISSRKDPSHTRKDLSEAQLMKILELLDNPPKDLFKPVTPAPEVRVLFTLGAFAGMRLADAALLKWEDVLLARGIIAFRAIKTARSTAKTVKIPIHPELASQLEMASAWQDDSGYVLPKVASWYERNPAGLKHAVVRVFEKGGYETSIKIEGRLTPASEYGFHSLRHTFVSICANHGVPLAIVQELVGHGNPAITRHYFHSDEKAVRTAIAALPSSKPAELPAASTKITPEDKLKAIASIIQSAKAPSPELEAILKVLQS